LSNVAYHVHTVGLHLTNYLQAQTNELDRMDLQIRQIGDRLKTCKDSVGAGAFRSGNDSIRGYKSKPKMRKLEENELPETSKPITKAGRQPLNLKALDSIGTDLGGREAPSNTSAPTLQVPPSYNKAFSGQSQSNMNSRNPPPPPTTRLAPPSPVFNRLQNSNDQPPPPPPRDYPQQRDQRVAPQQTNQYTPQNSNWDMMAPPPPPPMDFNSTEMDYDDMDAPPPPPFDADLPPPPPPNF